MNKYALSAVLALAMMNAGTLAAQKTAARKPEVKQKTGMFASLDAWMKHVREKLSRNQEISPQDFDGYFSDDYFRTTEDPLMEMDNIKKRIDADMEIERELFQRSYNDWHAMRTEMPELDTQVTTAADKIVVSVKKPVEKPESLKIAVKKNLITMDFSSKSETESDKAGEMAKSASFVESRKIMSVPLEADPARFTIEDAGDRMNIVFAKKEQK